MASAFVGTPLAATSFSGRRLRSNSCNFARQLSITRRPIQAALDPTTFIDTHHHTTVALGAISHLLSTAASVTADTADVAGDAANAAAAAAGAAAATTPAKTGPIASLASVIEGCLLWLHTTLKGFGVPGSYGISIVLFTGVVKAALFPLNWKQMESTIKMQAITPKLKQIQNEYKDNPQVINQMTAKLYKDEDINPILGCVPIFLQLPVWLALYRALQNMAKEDILKESFLWIPSLQGPVNSVGQSLSTWLFPFINGEPPIGWHDAIAYLILPALIVGSQIITTRVMSPNSNDPSQKQANTMNKVLPVIIGWFVLNVPSALGLYMFTNNILSTAQTVFVKNALGASAGGGATAAAIDSTITTTAKSVDTKSAPPDGFSGNGALSTTSTASKPKSGKAGKGGKKRRKRR